MKKMILLLVMILSLIWFGSCQTVSNIVTPEDVSMAVDLFVQIGLPYVLKAGYDRTDNVTAYLAGLTKATEVIESVIIPFLSKEGLTITDSDVENILDQLGSVLGIEEQRFVQTAIEYLLRKLEQLGLPEEGDHLLKQELMVLRTLFISLTETTRSFIRSRSVPEEEFSLSYSVKFAY